MTNTYDTSNEPLGSTAVKVLHNNASNLDEAVNSDADTWVDRPPFGRVHRTWRGMENAFDAFLAGTAFELPPVVYVDGTPLQVDRATQLIERSGLLYSVKLPSDFPVTLSGTWATDEPLLTVRNDQSLRQQLAGSAGSSLVGVPSGGNLAQAVTYVTPNMFGGANDGVADDYTAITNAAAYAAANNVELWMGGPWAISAGLDFSAVRKIRCFNDCTIIPTFNTGVAVKWVAASGVLIEKPIQEGDMHVNWPARDWTKERTSFLLQNIYNGRFCFSSSRSTRGLLLKGLERGCVYNDIDIGVFANNLVGVWFTSGSANGWSNANRIFGGRFYGANGSGAGQTVAGSLYESRAGHIYIETTPYACNGNVMLKNSLEWVGPGYRLARMGGLSNRLEPTYGELLTGDTTWIVDTGTNNLIDVVSVPSISFGYDPDLAGASNRIDVSLATNPQVRGTNNYASGNGVSVFRAAMPSRAPLRGENTSTGPGIEARSQNSGANPGLVVTGPGGAAGVAIPPAGPWVVYNGTKKVLWSAGAAPTTGTWERGDFVYFTNPSAGGKVGAICVAGGTPGTWKSWGAIDA